MGVQKRNPRVITPGVLIGFIGRVSHYMRHEIGGKSSQTSELAGQRYRFCRPKNPVVQALAPCPTRTRGQKCCALRFS